MRKEWVSFTILFKTQSFGHTLADWLFNQTGSRYRKRMNGLFGDGHRSYWGTSARLGCNSYQLEALVQSTDKSETMQSITNNPEAIRRGVPSEQHCRVAPYINRILSFNCLECHINIAIFLYAAVPVCEINRDRMFLTLKFVLSSHLVEPSTNSTYQRTSLVTDLELI